MKKKLLLFFSFSIIPYTAIAMDGPPSQQEPTNSLTKSTQLSPPTYLSMLREATNLSTKSNTMIDCGSRISYLWGVGSLVGGSIPLGIGIAKGSILAITAGSCCLVQGFACFAGSVVCMNELRNRQKRKLLNN